MPGTICCDLRSVQHFFNLHTAKYAKKANHIAIGGPSMSAADTTRSPLFKLLVVSSADSSTI